MQGSDSTNRGSKIPQPKVEGVRIYCISLAYSDNSYQMSLGVDQLDDRLLLGICKHGVQVLNNAWLGVVVAEPLVFGIYVTVIASTDTKGINIFVFRCQDARKHIERHVFLVWSSDLVKAAKQSSSALFVCLWGFCFFQNCCEYFWLCMSSHEYRHSHSNEIHSCTDTPLTTFK